jgi:hypothetical protein
MKSLILILAFFSASAFSQMKHDGNQLLDFMNGKADMQEGFAYGYIVGISRITCRPNGVTNGQMYDIVKKYLIQNPQFRHETMGSLVFDALNEAFPCNKKPV